MVPKTFSTTEVVELPFGLAGKIYRSPMPFRGHDRHGELFDRFQELDASAIVLLAEETECTRETGRDLGQYYLEHGLEVIHLPIPDYDVPNRGALDQGIATTLDRARRGDNIVAHCQGGFGRTGTFLACLAKRQLGLTGVEAISWVREYVPGAVETEEQTQFIIGY